MKVQLEHNDKRYTADLSNPIDLSIPVREYGDNPNCYYAEPVVFETIRAGTFVGSVAEGGSVNYQSLTITPHGNGTHTECYGHIADDGATLNQCLKTFHFVAQLITLPATSASNGDTIITVDDFEEKYIREGAEAVIIRTLPNTDDKKLRKYSGTNPCYLDSEITAILTEDGVKHLLVDLPSVDREVDGGALKAHRAFWDMEGIIRKDCTISELIFVDNDIPDGTYLLNLQITSLEMDASPSKPVLFKMEEY